jgi:hypothetical protein
MRIPEIRDEMHDLADIIRDKATLFNDLTGIAERLHELADATHRKKAIMKSPRTSSKITSWHVQETFRLHREFPDMSQQAIANKLMTSPGRISEILNGLRDDNGEKI